MRLHSAGLLLVLGAVVSALGCTSGSTVADAPSCTGGRTDCSGVCVDLTVDPANCGKCGAACAAGNQCVAGACTVVCPASQTACEAGCTNVLSDNLNCGSCGNACPAGKVCSM